MKHCNLFIGNDSGLMHMAALANIKTFGLLDQVINLNTNHGER